MGKEIYDNNSKHVKPSILCKIMAWEKTVQDKKKKLRKHNLIFSNSG